MGKKTSKKSSGKLQTATKIFENTRLRVAASQNKRKVVIR